MVVGVIDRGQCWLQLRIAAPQRRDPARIGRRRGRCCVRGEASMARVRVDLWKAKEKKGNRNENLCESNTRFGTKKSGLWIGRKIGVGIEVNEQCPFAFRSDVRAKVARGYTES